jgi:SAM-dependent methyltransferase
VYTDQARGITALGRLIDRIMLDHPVWQGVRARRELLIGQLRAAVDRRPGQRLLDVAAGPGSYLFELPPGVADYYAADIDADERARGTARARAEGRADIHFVAADAFDPATWPGAPFDILVASGFFDLLVDVADVRRLLAAGTAGTRPGARWVLSVMEGHPDLKLLSDVLVDWDGKPWTAVTRSADEVIAEAEWLGWRAMVVEHEPRRQFGVVTLERVATRLKTDERETTPGTAEREAAEPRGAAVEV